ncbi:hypothetical protein D3C85_1082290 [compost metagenome]
MAGQVAPFGVGLVVTAAQFQQPGAVGAGHKDADRVKISRRQGQGAVPVPGGGSDPRLDIEARAGVGLADGGGLQHGVGAAGVAVDKGLHRSHQTTGLDDDGRDALAFRRDPRGDVEVARQQGGGEGLLADAGLFGGQSLDPRQIVGARLALAAGQGVAARQIVAVGAATLGVGRDRSPGGRDGRGLRRRRCIGDDDFGVLAVGVSRGRRLRGRRRFRLHLSGRRVARQRLRRLLRQGGRGDAQRDQRGGGEQGGTAEGKAHGRTLHAFPSARKGLKPLALTCSDSWGRRRLRAWSRRCSATGP